MHAYISAHSCAYLRIHGHPAAEKCKRTQHAHTHMDTNTLAQGHKYTDNCIQIFALLWLFPFYFSSVYMFWYLLILFLDYFIFYSLAVL